MSKDSNAPESSREARRAQFAQEAGGGSNKNTVKILALVAVALVAAVATRRAARLRDAARARHAARSRRAARVRRARPRALKDLRNNLKTV